ncbi:hypothetical protein [Phytoactinopolyspora mesophila]|uniref:Uncharacterized protein n=1 Tax=Phytoactinopolyspora mesophila TaxID=2650750 RepID=A0A7K3M4C4_9ACTN|nr:hypothetical protein [Phytoactinopolyspora mesophila]
MGVDESGQQDPAFRIENLDTGARRTCDDLVEEPVADHDRVRVEYTLTVEDDGVGHGEIRRIRFGGSSRCGRGAAGLGTG